MCVLSHVLCFPNRKLTHTQKHIYRFFLRNLILPCRFFPRCFLSGFEEKKNSSILFFFSLSLLYLLKSHFIKVMDNASNKIGTSAIIARQWRPVAGRTKYDSPLMHVTSTIYCRYIQLKRRRKKKVDSSKLVPGSPPGGVYFF